MEDYKVERAYRVVIITLLIVIWTLTGMIVYLGKFFEPKVQVVVETQIEEVPKYIYVETMSECPDPLSHMTQEEQIKHYILEICKDYPNVNPYLIMGQVWAESRFDPTVISSSGEHVGLMQVSTKWHRARADRLGVEDMFDIYGNLLVGIDYMSELLSQTHDEALSLMIYNMGYIEPYKLQAQGIVGSYARSVMAKADEYERSLNDDNDK